MKPEDLSPDLQEKLEMCETEEELEELAQAEGIELSDEDLDGIAGGVVNRKVRRRPYLLKKQKPMPRLQPVPQPDSDPAPSAGDSLSGTESAE